MKTMQQQVYDRLRLIAFSTPRSDFADFCIGWVNEWGYQKLRREIDPLMLPWVEDKDIKADFIYLGIRFLIVPVGRGSCHDRPMFGIEYLGDRI